MPSPLLLEIPIAAVASDHTLGFVSQFVSFASAWIPRACAIPAPIPDSSASLELSAIAVWVFDQCLTNAPPTSAQPPEVDLLVTAQPAKSVSQ